jgi:hypothetical protein
MNNTTQNFTDLLDECIEAVTTGRLTVADCLDQYPEHRAELAKLLSLLAPLQTARQAAPAPAFRQAARQRLLARLEPAALPPAPSLLDRLQGWWPQWWQQTTAVSPRPSLAWSLALLVLILFFFVGGGTLYAANQSLPGDTLYPVNQTVEKWRVELARDDQSRFELQLAFADKRLSEASRLARRGDLAHMNEALTGYQTLMQAVTQAVETADPTHQSQLASRVEMATAGHDVAFTRLLVAASQDAAVDLPADDELDEQRVMAIFCQPEATPTITHPVMAKMAAQYDVSDETINNWFCQGFGIGEIGLAYNLSQQTGTAVDDFFALRQAGYGWGQIMQQSAQLLPLLPTEDHPPATPVPAPTGRPDDAGPPDGRPDGRPDDAGPPDDRPGQTDQPGQGQGPPGGSGPPGQTDPPGQGQGPPGGSGPPGQTDPPGQGQEPPDGAGPPGQGQEQEQPGDGGRPDSPPGRGP